MKIFPDKQAQDHSAIQLVLGCVVCLASLALVVFGIAGCFLLFFGRARYAQIPGVLVPTPAIFFWPAYKFLRLGLKTVGDSQRLLAALAIGDRQKHDSALFEMALATSTNGLERQNRRGTLVGLAARQRSRTQLEFH